MSFFVFIRIAFMFVISAAFKKGELSVNKSTFNPFKLLVFVIVVTYLISSLFLISKMYKIFVKFERNCPGAIRRVTTHKTSDDLSFTCEFKTKK